MTCLMYQSRKNRLNPDEYANPMVPHRLSSRRSSGHAEAERRNSSVICVTIVTRGDAMTHVTQFC